MPGARPTAQDGGTLAGLVGRYGKEAVLRRIEDLSPELAAAREPLLYLAGSFRRPGPPAEAVTLAERKEELRKQMARTHGGIWGKP